jgi:site-specific recombinase XerD
MDTAMRITKALEWYLVAKASYGYSEHSIKANKWALDLMVEYLGDFPVNEIDSQMLQKFMLYVRKSYIPSRMKGNEAPLAGASVDRIWGSIRDFFKWAEIELGVTRPDL